MQFSDPQVILFVRDCERSAEFYAHFGFTETFRTSDHVPVKIEMSLGQFGLGLAEPDAAAASIPSSWCIRWLRRGRAGTVGILSI